MFTLEYSLWFDWLLPALQKMRAPIPLGGTSNFFRTSILKKVGGWDPYNVTEDADLGIRLARFGYDVEVIASTTFEEANCDLSNWVRQRSRWLKGYLQTWLVHMRHPRRIIAKTGLHGFLAVQLFVAGNLFSALIYPVMWSAFLVWLIWRPIIFEQIFPAPVFHLNLFALVFGNLFFIFMLMIGPLKRGWGSLSWYGLTAPAYWLLTSLAAYKALWQAVWRPHYWEKTEHVISDAARQRQAEALRTYFQMAKVEETAPHTAATQSTLAGRSYLKMNGLGNEFIILDLRKDPVRLHEEDIVKAAAPKTGPGCDQFITLEHRKGYDGVFMGVWNADGTEVGACGNAARCVGWLLMNETGEDSTVFHTESATLKAQRVGEKRIAVDMGEPKFGWREIPLSEQMDDTRFVDVKLGPIDAPVLWGPSAVNVGNPHCVFFVEDAEAQALDRFGPMIENHPLFPERVNVSVAQVTSKHAIRLRVWERGVGITKACGTAACAALVSAHRRRLTARKATVTLDGGDLAVEWREEDNHIIMTGPITLEGEGRFSEDF